MHKTNLKLKIVDNLKENPRVKSLAKQLKQVNPRFACNTLFTIKFLQSQKSDDKQKRSLIQLCYT